MQKILITGSSGFIGFHLAKRLLDKGFIVIGFDNENDYYDTKLKLDRRTILQKHENFQFYKGNVSTIDDIKKVFDENNIDIVINLAAQAGIRYSIENPFSYIQSNIVGFHNILYLSKEYKIQKFIYASSSSIYGNNQKLPFSIEDKADFPLSLYAATKKSDELIAHTYSHLFGLPTIGLRFFTVYGPWCRPDMAIFKFTDKIQKGEVIDVYNNGKMKRDFTYIDDVVEGMCKAIEFDTKYDIFNLGNNRPIELEYIISLIEKYLGKKAVKNYLPTQPGDMLETNADIQHTKDKLRWEPKIPVELGIKNFVDWFKDYYNKKV